MEEILHHLGCIKPLSVTLVNDRINYSAYYHQQYHSIQLHLFENYRHMKDGTPG